MENIQTENLESILSQINENKLSADDQIKIKEILGKYISKNVNEPNNTVLNDSPFEDGFEFPIIEEKVIPQLDENGQYQLFDDNPTQMELNLNINEEIVPTEEKLFVIPEIKEIMTENQSTDSYSDGRKEPIFNLDAMIDVNAKTATISPEILNIEKNRKFKNFETMASNTMGRFHNMFNFTNENGKIDWYNKAVKTVLVLKSVKDVALDNKVVNKLKTFINNKYAKSKLGMKTTEIADTITINLMSREERYNKDFKHTIALLGYDVKELITPNSTPMLTLQDVSDNVNKSLKENLNLELTDNGYSSKFLLTLSDENKVEFIQKMIWPKLTEMMGESVKLFEALNEIKKKNPLCVQISEMATKNNIDEDLFATMLVKNPEILKQKGIKGIDKLLEQKNEIENVYFKNEELAGKNFIVMQNLIKASSSMQKLIVSTNIPKEDKQRILIDMQKTTVKSDNKKKILFETIRDSVISSLQDVDFVKSLREVNESIVKIRMGQQQTKEQKNKPI